MGAGDARVIPWKCALPQWKVSYPPPEEKQMRGNNSRHAQAVVVFAPQQ